MMKKPKSALAIGLVLVSTLITAVAFTQIRNTALAAPGYI